MSREALKDHYTEKAPRPAPNTTRKTPKASTLKTSRKNIKKQEKAPKAARNLKIHVVETTLIPRFQEREQQAAEERKREQEPVGESVSDC